MDFQLHGASPSSSVSASTSSSDLHRHSNNSSIHLQNGHSPDPKHSRWESVCKARSRIHLLLSLLPSSSADDNPISSIAETDSPGRSLLLSFAAYSSLSASLSSPTSGAAADPLCNWLYDTYQSGDPDLRLVVLSCLPIISSVYLHRVHHRTSDDLVSLSGFEAVLLAIYNSEARVRNGRPVTVSIPDLSEPSLYHAPRNPIKSSSNSINPLVGVLSPPLGQQMSVKSSERASIVGVALDCYYKQIFQMPSWSKLDFCIFARIWAGQNCPCATELGENPHNLFGKSEPNENSSANVAERVKNLDIENGNSTEMRAIDARVPLPWEILQPILRILGHCLLGPLNVDDVKNAASIAVRFLYARATHDLVPQAILATWSLVQLDRRAREAALTWPIIGDDSNGNAPPAVKKSEMLLVSE